MSEKPWYPDERPWREHDGGPCPVDDRDMECMLISFDDRFCRRSSFGWLAARCWNWKNAVAYLTKSDADAWEAAQKAKAAEPSHPLAVGDLVKHVAPGSPVMRIIAVREFDERIGVEWWANGVFHFGRFYEHTLVRVPHE